MERMSRKETSVMIAANFGVLGAVYGGRYLHMLGVPTWLSAVIGFAACTFLLFKIIDTILGLAPVVPPKDPIREDGQDDQEAEQAN